MASTSGSGTCNVAVRQRAHAAFRTLRYPIQRESMRPNGGRRQTAERRSARARRQRPALQDGEAKKETRSPMMQLVKDMAFLVNHLMDERGAGSKHVEPQEDPRWFMEQWEQFRALVNTREPKPASPEFSEGAGPHASAYGCRTGHHRSRRACTRRLRFTPEHLARGHHGPALRRHRQRREQRASGLLDSRAPLHRQRHPHLRRRAAAPEVRADHAGTRLRGAGRPREGHARL